MSEHRTLTPGQQAIVERLRVKLNIDRRPARCGRCGVLLTIDLGPSLDDDRPVGCESVYRCDFCLETT